MFCVKICEMVKVNGQEFAMIQVNNSQKLYKICDNSCVYTKTSSLKMYIVKYKTRITVDENYLRIYFSIIHLSIDLYGYTILIHRWCYSFSHNNMTFRL